MAKTHKYKTTAVKKFKDNGSVEPGRDEESGSSGWPAADVDQSEALEEAAIVERLGRLGCCNNSHAFPQAPDMP